MAARAMDLDRSYRRARSRWTRLTVRTVNQVRDAYSRATDAVAARIEQTPGPVTRQTRTNVLSDLNASHLGGMVAWCLCNTAELV